MMNPSLYTIAMRAPPTVVPTMCRRHLETVPQSQTWIKGVVLKMDEDSGHKGDSDSDKLDHRYYLWSDYDSYFISNHFFQKWCTCFV